MIPWGPIFAALIVLGVNVLLGAPAPSAAVIGDLYLMLPTFILRTLVKGAFTEEPGWRGFALPRLQARYSPLKSSIIITPKPACFW